MTNSSTMLNNDLVALTLTFCDKTILQRVLNVKRIQKDRSQRKPLMEYANRCLTIHRKEIQAVHQLMVKTCMKTIKNLGRKKPKETVYNDRHTTTVRDYDKMFIDMKTYNYKGVLVNNWGSSILDVVDYKSWYELA